MGGHTGDIATLPLIPQCVDLVRGRTNFFGSPVLVVAAGGIYDGRGLSASLCLGASVSGSAHASSRVRKQTALLCTKGASSKLQALTQHVRWRLLVVLVVS